MSEKGNTKNPPKGAKCKAVSSCSTDKSVKPILKDVLNLLTNHLLSQEKIYFVSLTGKSYLSNEVSSKTTFNQPSTEIAKKRKLKNINKIKTILEALVCM